MTNFEIDFTTNLRSLKLKKKDVAKKLNMTPPTLKTKIQKHLPSIKNDYRKT